LAASALPGITFICAGLRVYAGGGGGSGLSSLPGKGKEKGEERGKRLATANGDPGSFYYSPATSTLVGGTEKRAG
jgi:hypothetical protein